MNSAAGSLKSGRKNSLYHGVMGLRGRTLNTIDKSIDQMLDNKELNGVFRAIGLGLDSFNVIDQEKTNGKILTQHERNEIVRKYARYGKIIISTDADADGSIIASTLLNTISKFSRFLIEAGMVYLIESPIYSQNGNYFYPTDELPDGTVPGLDMKKPFLRYKGLGELSKNEVYDSFFDESKRKLILVTIDGIDEAMELVSRIEKRKELLGNNSILTNPYKL